MSQDEHRDEFGWPTHDVDADPPASYPLEQASPHAAPRRIEPGGWSHPGANQQPAQQGVLPVAAGQLGATQATDGQAQGAEGAAGQRRARGLRRGLLLATTLLVLVAVGVVLALPPVSNRLALPWAPNAPKAEPPEPAAITRTLRDPATGAADRPTAEGVAAALRKAAASPALGELTGSVVDPVTGKTLWARGAGTPRTPASATKLLTGAAALLAFGPRKRIPTTVVAGREPGTVVLVAGGDPTLSALPEGRNSIYPGAAHLDQLVAEVEQATGGDVDKVAVDLTAYTGKTEAPGWDPVDVPKFTAAAVPAMLDGGRADPTAPHPERVGNPAGVLLHEFADRLGAQVARQSSVTAPGGAKVLGRVHSAPLPALVRRSLVLSDNVLADALARQVAMKTGHEPSFAGAAEAILNVLSEHGFDVGSARLEDGSGLSELNKVPAALLTDILAAAAAPAGDGPRTAELRPLLTALPVAGGTGTLAGRYTEQPATRGRGWVRAKTGTLTGVNTLAGTVVDSDGRVLVFAFMSSGATPDTARPALDRLAAALRTCGC